MLRAHLGQAIVNLQGLPYIQLCGGVYTSNTGLHGGRLERSMFVRTFIHA